MTDTPHENRLLPFSQRSCKAKDSAAGPLQHLAGELLLLNLCLKAGNVWVEYLVFMIRVLMCNSYHNHNAGWLTKL